MQDDGSIGGMVGASPALPGDRRSVVGHDDARMLHACFDQAGEGAVHMLQHQAGMAVRIDMHRFSALLEENAVLTRELAAVQQRSTRQAGEQARRIELQQGEIIRLRGELLGRDTRIAALGEELQVLAGAIPGLRSRAELSRECELLVARRNELQRLLLRSQQECERHLRRAEELASELQRRDSAQTEVGPATSQPHGESLTARLADRSILCVGGRTASVPVYRQLIERTGGRFLHHDGGEENNPAKLDDTLAAADLVICQTGCISHDAYWRVKDHCKRTGKKCVFAESPSSAGLKRALLTLVAAVAEVG